MRDHSLHKFSTLLFACVNISGCLLNAVHPIKHALPEKPDANHAIVVIGVGLDVPWPCKELSPVFDEYSLKKHDLTGNCFLYNRIELTRPSTPAPVSYFVFEVPASAYVYSGRNVNARLPASPNASGFIAPAGKTVYFGDYILVRPQSVELRRNLEAARNATEGLLARGSVLEAAEPITPARPRIPLHSLVGPTLKRLARTIQAEACDPGLAREQAMTRL